MSAVIIVSASFASVAIGIRMAFADLIFLTNVPLGVFLVDWLNIINYICSTLTISRKISQVQQKAPDRN